MRTTDFDDLLVAIMHVSLPGAPNGMISEPLTVLTISPDRALLREICWLLSDFGYRVMTATETTTLQAFVHRARPPIVIVDEEAVDGDCPIAHEPGVDASDRPFMLLMNGSPAKMSVSDALDAGFDDFLNKPPSHAEVLSRLRTAARSVELDLRSAGYKATDAKTGLLTRCGAILHLRRAMPANDASPCHVSCVAMEIDFFEHLEQYLGTDAGDQLFRRVAKQLFDHCGEGVLPVRLGAHRLGAVLVDASVDESIRWADLFRQSVSDDASLCREQGFQVTVSGGVSAHDIGRDKQLDATLWDQAEKALETAIAGGGNCVVPAGEFDAPWAAWRECLTRGNPFVGAKARDVMTPFTLWCTTGESAVAVADLLSHSCLPLLPVLDKRRRLLGLIRHEDLSATRTMPVISGVGVEDLMVTDFVKLSEQADYAVVMGHFFADDERPVVVYHDDEPRGFVTKVSFSTLISPLRTNTFSPRTPASSSDCLVVPDIERDEAPSARSRPTAAEASGLLRRMTIAANFAEDPLLGLR